MNEQDIIKANALRKLDDYVKCQLLYLVEKKRSLVQFRISRSFIDHLSKDEKQEINNSLEQLINGAVEVYCKYRGIDIPDQLIQKTI